MLVTLVVAGSLTALPAAHAVPDCPISYGSADDAKPNKLYLYYPLVADSSFPEFGGTDFETSPADPFDVSLLTSYTGTADQLRNAINDVVVDDYCEFNVQVRPTQTAPPTTFPRRATVAIGTDDNSTGRWGRADLVDTGDATALGFARVWAGRYQNDGSGSPGGALNGANSTVERWANAIGGTVAHEGGHTYGLTHSEGSLLAAGEDSPVGRHIMPAGSNVSSEERAGYRRHFNDANFATLAANVGLSIQTMHNWDLVNPNAQTGHQYRLTFLSPQTDPIMSWSYGGTLSPWSAPTVTAAGTQTFRGTSYNRFRLTWSTDKAWSGGPDGQVPGGASFHIGATFSGVDFNQPDPIIIVNSELLDASGNPLALKPRLVGYDAGELDGDDGSFDINFFGTMGGRPQLRDVVVQELPRAISIDAMVGSGRRLFDWTGQRVRAYGKRRTVLRRRVVPVRRRGLSVRVADLGDPREILTRVGRDDCDVGDSAHGPDSAACRPGYNVSLFPATTLYLTARVVYPRVRRFDRRRKRYVVGPLESRIFYQLGGIHPDLNRNGVDDAIDIASGRARDRDENGVPDSAQRG